MTAPLALLKIAVARSAIRHPKLAAAAWLTNLLKDLGPAGTSIAAGAAGAEAEALSGSRDPVDIIGRGIQVGGAVGGAHAAHRLIGHAKAPDVHAEGDSIPEMMGHVAPAGLGAGAVALGSALTEKPAGPLTPHGVLGSLSTEALKGPLHR